MNVTPLADFFYMGGYAFYVWASFGLCALFFFIEIWRVRSAHRDALQNILQSIPPATSTAAHLPATPAP